MHSNEVDKGEKAIENVENDYSKEENDKKVNKKVDKVQNGQTKQENNKSKSSILLAVDYATATADYRSD